MQEGLATEHGSELLGHTFEQLLDGSGVTNEGDGHLETLGRNIADGRLDVVGDPLHEVRGVLVLDVEHLLIDFLGGHASTEHGRGSEVTTVTRIASSHHVLGIEHLLGELRDSQSAVLLRATRGQGSEADHEEVETGEGDEVDSQLTQIRVQLTRETQAAGDAGHDSGHEVVQVTEGGGSELEGTEADVVQGLIVNAHDFISVFDQLVHRQSGVVWLHDGIRHLGRRHDGEGEHHTIGVLLTDLGDQEGSHAGAGTTSERVADLEALEAIAGLGLLTDDIENGVNELSTLSVVTLCENDKSKQDDQE